MCLGIQTFLSLFKGRSCCGYGHRFSVVKSTDYILCRYLFTCLPFIWEADQLNTISNPRSSCIDIPIYLNLLDYHILTIHIFISWIKYSIILALIEIPICLIRTETCPNLNYEKRTRIDPRPGGKGETSLQLSTPALAAELCWRLPFFFFFPFTNQSEYINPYVCACVFINQS